MTYYENSGDAQLFFASDCELCLIAQSSLLGVQ
jgi:hypothetical protein